MTHDQIALLQHITQLVQNEELSQEEGRSLVKELLGHDLLGPMQLTSPPAPEASVPHGLRGDRFDDVDADDDKTTATLSPVAGPAQQVATAPSRAEHTPSHQTVSPESQPQSASKPLAPASSSIGGAVLGLGIGAALLIVLFAGAGLNQLSKERKAQKAAGLRAAAWAELETFKTDEAANGEATWLQQVQDRLDAADELDPTNTDLPARALVSVWRHKWHYGSAKWNPRTFAEDDALTQAALSTGAPEAFLARALLLSNACHLMPNDATRNTTCTEGIAAYRSSDAAFRNDPRRWLAFESTWTHAYALNAYADVLYAEKSTAAAERMWVATLDLCQEGVDRLADGPVNAPELIEECAEAAGALERYPRWVISVAWLRDNVQDKNRKTPFKALAAAYRNAHPTCHGIRLERHRKYGVLVPDLDKPRKSRRTDNQYFCYAAGLMALGCGDLYEETATFASRLAPDMPWDLLKRHRDSVPAGQMCALTMR